MPSHIPPQNALSRCSVPGLGPTFANQLFGVKYLSPLESSTINYPHGGAKGRRLYGEHIMATITLNLEGVPVTVTQRNVEVTKLRLDEGNPRIGLYRDSQPKEHLSDADMLFAIKNRSPYAYAKLRESIEINHGIINPIWIGPEENGEHLVIEGNTRVLVYRELAQKYPASDEWKTIRANVLPMGIQESQVNFIRLEAHLRGVTEWDAYERARYLYILNEEEGYSVPRLEQLTRLDARKIQIEIRAFRDMAATYHERFPNDPYEAQKFSYFVEFESSPKIQQKMQVQGKNLEDFCEWVGEGRLPKAENVRQLPEILADDSATTYFLSEGYEKALEHLALAKPDIVSPLYRRIEEVIDGLRQMPFYQIEEIRAGDAPGRRRLIEQLAEVACAIRDRVTVADEQNGDSFNEGG